jgi:hypothetical protein
LKLVATVQGYDSRVFLRVWFSRAAGPDIAADRRILVVTPLLFLGAEN